MAETVLNSTRYTLQQTPDNATHHCFSTNTSEFELSPELNDQARLYLLIYHCVMFVLGTVGNALLFVCTLRHREEPNTYGATLSALLGRDKGRNFRINRVVILENLSFNGLMISLTVMAPVLTSHALKRWVLGHVMCKLIAQSTEIVYISGLLVYFTMSLHRLGVVVCPNTNIKPSQIRLLTMWLWVGTTFMVIFLNIISVSSAEFDQFQGTCSILNNSSYQLPRLVVYAALYGGSLLTIFTCAVVLSIQSLCGRNPELDESLAPSLFFYAFTWTALLVKMLCVTFDWKLAPLADVATTSAPELQVAFNPILVFWWHAQLRDNLRNLVRCGPCRGENLEESSEEL